MTSPVENGSEYGTGGGGDSTVPALARALDILELLEASETALTLSEIAAHLELPKGSAHRLLSTLRARGYVEQAHGGGIGPRSGYRLGSRLLAMAAWAQGQLDVTRAAQEPMRRLAEATGEGCQLSIRSAGRALCIARVPSPSHPEVALMGTVGAAFPLHAVAVGKALLAFAPDVERAAYLSADLAAFTPHTVTDPDALADELAAIRASGIARDEQEYKLGLRALAAPIFDASGAAVAALALPLLVGGGIAADDEHCWQAEQSLRAAAQAVSQALGYRKET